MLTPVPNPSAYGLVETDAGGRVRRFLEKPDPSQITTDTINAGIYVLRDRDPRADARRASTTRSSAASSPPCWSAATACTAHVHRGYWIDIGTPEKYLQVHRDILGGALPGGARRRRPRAAAGSHAPAHASTRAPSWRRPFYVGPGLPGRARAPASGPDAVLTADVTRGRRARGCATRWSGRAREIGDEAPRARARCSARGCASARSAVVAPGAVLGEGTVRQRTSSADAVSETA